jgi:hypothetical protein
VADCSSLPADFQKQPVWQRLGIVKRRLPGSQDSSQRALVRLRTPVRPPVWQRLSGMDKVHSLGGARKTSVWRRLASSHDRAAMEPVMDLEKQPPLQPKRKRRRSKRGKGTAVLGNSQSPPADLVPLTSNLPSCVLELSTDMAREEVALRRALFVTVTGTRPVVLGSEVLEEVARRYCINIDDMSIHQSKPEDFLLFLPDEEVATRVLNEGKPFRGPLFSLVFKQWTRFAHASATSFSHLMDIEIRGIPAHAWGLNTAKKLLHGSCHILELHPASACKTDLSSLKLQAWCLDPKKLCRDMDLHIIEREPFIQEARCLTYKISIAASPAPLQLPSDSSLPPSDENEFHGEEDGDVRGPSNPRFRQPRPLQRQPVHHRLGSHQGVGRERSVAVHGNRMVAPVLALEDGAAVCAGDGLLTSPGPSSPQHRCLAEPLEKARLSSPLPATHVPCMTTLKNILAGPSGSAAVGSLDSVLLVSPQRHRTVAVAGSLEQAGANSPLPGGSSNAGAPLRVYSRSRFRSKHAPIQEGQLIQVVEVNISERPCLNHSESVDNSLSGCTAVAPALDFAAESQPHETASFEARKQEFFKGISKYSSGILPVPRAEPHVDPPPSPPAAPMPRRSRRVAGVGVEFNLLDLGGRTTRKVMRSLLIISENEGISQEALDEYTQLFKRPLTRTEVEALAALFGWRAPELVPLQ